VATLTLAEARRAVMLAHPGWHSSSIDNEARRMLAGEGRLAALDKLEAEVAQRAADGLPAWPESEQQRWERERFASDMADAEARATAAKAQRAEAKPAGWEY
jgi:hypothetical protein